MTELTQSTLPDSYRYDAFQQRGFTLLEMVLVLFLIGLLASAGLLFTEGVEDQAKYDETKRRMELIRKAIVGDPTRTINGTTEISGFAADMGRLPGCIRELLVNKACDDSQIEEWDVDPDNGIGAGWRGPYIQVIADRDGEVRYRDGYGSLIPYGYHGLDVDDVDELNSKNFGWQWLLFDESGDTLSLTEAKSAVKANLQSLGFDVNDPVDDIPRGDTTNIPSLIVSNDWRIILPNLVTVNFTNQSDSKAYPESDLQLLLRLFSPEFADYIDVTDGINMALTLTQSEVPELTTRTKSFVLPDAKEISMGHRTYAVVCYEAPPTDPNDFVIFDGDCEGTNSTPSSSNIRTFSVVPRNSLNLQLDWIIPTP